ncbi:MAG: hypothetical protein D6784_04935 [Chloroflexi bacterium]|nr:MAG: hypothetical protein D6784_04935 [Chloroflexota bacterium]
MAGKITALKRQVKRKDRVSVFIEGEYAFSLMESAAAVLSPGQYLSDEEIDRLQQADLYQKAYHQALRYLGIRARSQAEMEQYLTGKDYPPAVVAATLARLQREGYLNDADFAGAWVDSRGRLKPKGKRALQYELKQKGIANELIESALAGLDEENLAWAAVESRLSRWKNLDDDRLKQKVWGFLARRGFDYEIARLTYEKVRAVLSNQDD